MLKSAGAYNGKVLNARLQDCKNARFGVVQLLVWGKCKMESAYCTNVLM